MITDLTLLSTRQLQKEAARALAAGEGFGNHDLVRFNKLAHHDSHAWYRAVISWYVDTHGDLPSRVGPGVAVKLLVDDANDI
jgi:hypothetical protein